MLVATDHHAVAMCDVNGGEMANKDGWRSSKLLSNLPKHKQNEKYS